MSETFEDSIHTVVVDFLETALVVDDEPEIRLTAGEGRRPPSGDVAERGMGPRPRIDLSLETPPEKEIREAVHPLAMKPLIDGFADVGIVCSVLAVGEDDDVKGRFLKLAARADLLVIDWELHRDGGETARNLIASIVEQDAKAARKRLRVISIYTGQPGLEAIVEAIREHLALPGEALGDQGVTLAHGNIRITAFNKPFDEPNLRDEVRVRAVPERELPRRLVGEFACLTSGLVPAVALASLAAIRNDTHRILAALPGELDVGYLGHRAALPFPDDAEDSLVEMIVAEIGSILGEHNVGRRANLDVVKQWLQLQWAAEDPLVCGSALPDSLAKIGLQRAEIETIVESGLGLDDQLSEYKRDGLSEAKLKRVRKHADRLFARDADAARSSTDLLATRLAVRTIYSRPARRLRLGTIVARGEQYFVCVQPRCDSVRLPPGEAREFPFLPLKSVGLETETSRHFIIEDPPGGLRVGLRLSTKPYDLAMHAFEPGPQRCVEAVQEGDNWVFEAPSGAGKLRWVAELKPEFAQRVAVDFAADIARVGLAECELVRLSRG